MQTQQGNCSIKAIIYFHTIWKVHTTIYVFFYTDVTYLGFKWKGEYYVYNVLPFGLDTSGYTFSKVVREIVKYWRAKGLKIIMYLDDGLGGGDN